MMITKEKVGLTGSKDCNSPENYGPGTNCKKTGESPTSPMGWKRRLKMRVASLENLLTLATLVSAVVVVLWGIRIYQGG